MFFFYTPSDKKLGTKTGAKCKFRSKRGERKGQDREGGAVLAGELMELLRSIAKWVGGRAAAEGDQLALFPAAAMPVLPAGEVALSAEIVSTVASPQHVAAKGDGWRFVGDAPLKFEGLATFLAIKAGLKENTALKMTERTDRPEKRDCVRVAGGAKTPGDDKE